MKTVSVAALSLYLALATAGVVSAFQSTSTTTPSLVRPTTIVLNMAYIPDGFTKESYAKFKAEEKAKQAKKNLGRMGPKGFQSRSFQSFQEALERGEAAHLMPVMNAKERVRKGELRKEDIPYMQRGGAWDNSDVKGAKKAKWLKSDKSYADGGYKKEQSASIFGYGAGLDWTGKRDKAGPEGVMAKKAKFDKNYKRPNIYDDKKKNDGDDKPKKKLFGLF
jgi:hypothetical protein